MFEGVNLTQCLMLFVVGLLGGGHCLGMCGGIVSALSSGDGGTHRMSLLLGYHGGRLLSYSVAGALVGLLGAGGLLLTDTWWLRLFLYALASLMMVGMGLYLLGFPALLLPIERAGDRLWRHIRPLALRFFPVRHVAQALPLGFFWGWLPCGLVYSALATALSSGSPISGGLLMLSFGIGTLPNLLLASILLARLNAARRDSMRRFSGLIVLAYGVWGLWQLWSLLSSGQNVLLAAPIQ